MIKRIAFIVFLASSSAIADFELWSSGLSNAEGFRFNGDTWTVPSGGSREVVLTQSTLWQAGVVTASTEQATRSFSCSFSFSIDTRTGSGDASGENGGDGIAFLISDTFPSKSTVGDNLQLNPGEGSIIIEFDTRQDSWDTDSNHIALRLGNSVGSVVSVSAPKRLDEGDRWTAWIDYDGTNLTVRAAASSTRPAQPLITYPINLPARVSDSAWFSMIGSTTASASRQILYEWKLTADGFDPAFFAAYPNSVGVGGDWFYSPWAGYLNIAHFPWIYSEKTGFYWSHGNSESLYRWSANKGSWSWTSASVYPWVIDIESGVWRTEQ